MSILTLSKNELLKSDGALTQVNERMESSHGIVRVKVDRLKDKSCDIPEVDSVDYFNELLKDDY